MKKNQSLLLLSIILITILSCSKDDVDIVLEEKEEIFETLEKYKDYIEPDYPSKPSGRYISYTYVDFPDLPVNPNAPAISIISGKKVQFNYNSKNYCTSVLLYGSDDNQLYEKIEIEYNKFGKAHRIKKLKPNGYLKSYDKCEYDSLGRMIKMSQYKNIDSNSFFETSEYEEFYYPTSETIVRYFCYKDNNFKKGRHEKYILDTNGNVRFNFSIRDINATTFNGTKYFYSDKRKLYHEIGLPKYDFGSAWLRDYEILSVNECIASQYYKFLANGTAIPNGEISSKDNLSHDCQGYPSSLNGSDFYYADR